MSTYVITELRTPSVFSTHSFTPAVDERGTGPGALRLTRRGRLVFFVAALMVVLALSVMFGGGSVATSEKGEASPTEVITVGQGDTLWAIASEIAGDTGERDVRTVMAHIEDLNGLDSTMLQAGQQLRIPQTG
jgi:LysM domain